ncbi:hypothetical protein BCR33DRAFT_781923 [Rhizoclosmatium globosum]|uniref:Uncharacterized protein n=1 Tax=Rhizoclosmatium globosum TaxID=329046 RepID=A0A1Y2CPF1_9FUNG|nr:hypothetical protein BCR33DRAFT_781923 [Rhizoclosmatium globosum]|eukprot:ORY48910.1 hypothetical protein BCR33DRAFT_781923 [Rhizoclosmatium globosum]
MSLVTPLGLPTAHLIKQTALLQVVSSTLSAFTAKHASDQTFVGEKGLFSVTDKRDSVTALCAALTQKLDNYDSASEDEKSLLDAWRQWPEDVTVLALQTLKILGREVEGSESLQSESGIKMLMAHIGYFEQDSTFTPTPVSVEAMKCLVNCLHVNEQSRDKFVELNGIEMTLKFLENERLSMDAKFLALRFLFLLSGHSSVYAERLGKSENLGQQLHTLIQPYFQHLLEQKRISSGMGNELSIPDEILKIVFNVSMSRAVEGAGLGGLLGGLKGNSTPEEKAERRAAENQKKIEAVKGFEMFLPILVDIITCIPINEKDPLSPPHSFAINCLLNFPASPDFFLSWLPGPNKDKIPEQLCKILSLSLALAMPYNVENAIPLELVSSPIPGEPNYSKLRADEIIPPVVLILKDLANCHEKLRAVLREMLTPESIDRTKKLDSTDTTVARLIRMMTSISCENLKTCVGELLYALFDEDASKLTSYIGYGNAAGFLFQRGIMSDPNGGSQQTRPSSSSSDRTAHDSEEYEIYDGPRDAKGKSKAQPKINPITGEIMSDEKQTNEEWDRLSDAEKEYETHKLMEMLEKLNKSGIIKAVRKEDIEGQGAGGSGTGK